MRNKHSISRKNISKNALKVLYRLYKSGYESYLVGGSVRDLLLKKKPKDFDVTTNATPEQVRKLFRNCRLVGHRFRLAHVLFEQEIIEVATLRGHHKKIPEHNNSSSQKGWSGILLRDNTFGSIEEDAQRRDFTINSLYYCIADFTLRDYVNGLHDLEQGVIRLIGDPEVRYREDPVRMLRAIRFAATLGMTISDETAKPIPYLAPLLHNIAPARLFAESLKLLLSGYSYATYLKLREYQIFQLLFPLLARDCALNNKTLTERSLVQALKNIDCRLQKGNLVNPAFLFAAILWHPLLDRAQIFLGKHGRRYYEAFSLAINDVLDEQCHSLAIPKSITTLVRDIWQLQLRLIRRKGKRAYKIMGHPKFYIAYDLLELRAEAKDNQEILHLAEWWREFQIATSTRQKTMLQALSNNQSQHHQTQHKRDI